MFIKMNDTVSVSKGCFAFPKKKKDTLGQYPHDPWYKAYKNAWSSFKVSLEEIENKSLKEVLKGVVNYVTESPNEHRQDDELPTAALLTGVNMPDHNALFNTLTSELKKDVTPHVAVLWAQDCPNLKTTVERLCSQFMTDDGTESDSDAELSDEGDNKSVLSGSLSKSHCTLPVLCRWYSQLDSKTTIKLKTKKLKSTGAGKPLAVVIPNFECFSHRVLQDFILVLSANRKKIPLMLILGVATAVSAVHRSLPHHVSSKLCIQLFHTLPTHLFKQTSRQSIETNQPTMQPTVYLNQILDKVIFDPDQPFHLGSKTFKVLVDVFLFYDFSVAAFVQEFKYCMTEHFFGKNWTALCCHYDQLEKAVSNLKIKDIENILSLPSLQKYIQSLDTRKEQISWFKDEDFFKAEIVRLLTDLHNYCSVFYFALRSLHIFVGNLPRNPLGKHLREIYAVAVSRNITLESDYQECCKLLRFQARDELLEKLKEILVLFQSYENRVDFLSELADEIEDFIVEIETLGSAPKSPANAGLRSPIKSPLASPRKGGVTFKNRAQFREKIFELTAQSKAAKSPYEELRDRILRRMERFWEESVLPANTRVLHEVMFFDDLSAVRSNMIATPRLAVHTALNDPHHYLQCNCCKLENQQDVLPSLPDLSIVYKLHLESGRHINMYDWLQAYLTIVNPDDNADEQRDVDPKLQQGGESKITEITSLHSARRL